MNRFLFASLAVLALTIGAEAQNCYEYTTPKRVCSPFTVAACGGSRCSSPSSPCYNNPNPSYAIAGDDFWMDDPDNPGQSVPREEPDVTFKVDGQHVVSMNVWECQIVGACGCAPDQSGVLRCYMGPGNPINGMSPVLGGPNCGPPPGGGGGGPGPG